MNAIVFRFLEWHRRLGLRRMPWTILQWLVRREYFVLVRNLQLPLPKVPVDQTMRWTLLTEAEIPQLLAINPLMSETEIRRRWKEGQECSLCWIGGSLAHYRWYATDSVFIPYLGKTLRPLEGDCLIEDVFTHPAFRRRGVDSVGSLMTLHQLQGRGFWRAIAIVARYNAPTLRVTQKSGYTVAGAIGYWNVALWRHYFVRGKVCLDGRTSMYVEHVAPEFTGDRPQRRRGSMKICLVAPVSGWRGGTHQYAVNLANSLAGRVKVEVVGYKSLFPLWFYPGKSKRLLGEIPVRQDILVHESLRYYSVLSSLRAAAVIENQVRPDVVDIHWIAPQHGFVLVPLMSRLRYKAKIRIVLTVHNVLPHERRVFDRGLSRSAFRLSHRLLVHAESMKEEIVRTFGVDPRKIAVIPHGICASGEVKYTRTQARARLGIKEKQVILFFGFVRPYKGLEYLIRAFKELADRFDVALVIAGEFFSGLGQCQKELQKAGIAERTYLFPRYIPYEEVPLFFGAADVLVQPYVRFSGQSGVTQTAYLHSLPVVATEVGGLPELVLHGKTGYIVKPGNVGELALAIEALLADVEKRREYGANGRRFLETHLAWERIVERLLEIYAES